MNDVMKIEAPTMRALVNYVQHGQRTGAFLHAFLTGSLAYAIGHADDNNILCFREIYQWLYNYTPSLCYGSPEEVAAWLQRTPEDREVLLARCIEWTDWLEANPGFVTVVDHGMTT